MGFASDTVTQERDLGALCQKWGGDKDKVFLTVPQLLCNCSLCQQPREQ